MPSEPAAAGIMESEGWHQLLIQDEEETPEAADTDMPDVELQAADSAGDGGDAPSDQTSDDGADPAERAATAAAPGAPAGELFGLVHSVRHSAIRVTPAHSSGPPAHITAAL